MQLQNDERGDTELSIDTLRELAEELTGLKRKAEVDQPLTHSSRNRYARCVYVLRFFISDFFKSVYCITFFMFFQRKALGIYIQCGIVEINGLF